MPIARSLRKYRCWASKWGLGDAPEGSGKPGVLIASESALLIPDPFFLAFFDSLAFFCFPISLAFLCVCPFFSKDFRGSVKRKNLAFFRGFPCFFCF